LAFCPGALGTQLGKGEAEQQLTELNKALPKVTAMAVEKRYPTWKAPDS
jgi:hypothetical protein